MWHSLWFDITAFPDSVAALIKHSHWLARHTERCGSVTLSSGTAAVLFSSLAAHFNADEPNTSYSITLSGNADESYYWSSKATTGFTINSGNGASTATVDWKVSRA